MEVKRLNDIFIYDVYPYLHTASNVAKFANVKVDNFPVGGIRFFMRKFVASILDHKQVACCFDGQSPKGTRFPGYKGNRKLKPSVIAQADYLFNILNRCGVQSYRGFAEADDYIYNIVEDHYKSLGRYDFIYIWGADYDLCHNVTEFNVGYRTVNSNTNNVSWDSFSRNIGLSDEEITFNTITAYKALCGDSSDCIPKFTFDNGVTGLEMYRRFKTFLSNKGNLSGRITRRRDLLEAFLNDQGVSDSDLSKMKGRLDAVYPKDLTSRFPNGFPLCDRTTINLQLLADYCFVIKDYVSLGSFKRNNILPRTEEELSNLQSELYQLGQDFSSGAYAVDRNLPIKNCNTFSETFRVREL